MIHGRIQAIKSRLATIVKAMKRHPAFPLMGRVVAYWLLVALILVVVVATQGTPIGHLALFPGVIAVSILMWMIRRRLNDTQRMLRAGQEKPKSLFARMKTTIRSGKDFL